MPGNPDVTTRKSSLVVASGSDKSGNVDYEEQYNDELDTSVALIVKHFEESDNKKFGRTRKFPANSGS